MIQDVQTYERSARDAADGAEITKGTRTEERVSVTYGDRLCTHCHYNLIGQPVLREPYYSMLIVRCPECGTVAAMQEYPQLGRWANRWSVISDSLALPAPPPHLVLMPDPTGRLNAALEGRYRVERELGEGGMACVDQPSYFRLSLHTGRRLPNRFQVIGMVPALHSAIDSA